MPHTNRKKKTSISSSTTAGPQPTTHHLHQTTKRILIDDVDGWTHVVDAPRRRRGGGGGGGGGHGLTGDGAGHVRSGSHSQTQDEQRLESQQGEAASINRPRARTRALTLGDWDRDGVPYVDMDPEGMRREYEFWAKGWRESRAATELKRLMCGSGDDGDACGLVSESTETAEEPRGLHPTNGHDTTAKSNDSSSRRSLQLQHVQKVVCLGLGSLQSARREGRRASCTQLAALSSILECLCMSTYVLDLAIAADDAYPASASTIPPNPTIPCIIQDPQFTDLDRDFLTARGYQVVNDPEAFPVIDEGTLVYAIHCYARVYAAVAERRARPAVIIGTDVDNFGRFSVSDEAEKTAKTLVDMVHGYESIAFPPLRHDFSDTVIYVRKDEEEVQA